MKISRRAFMAGTFASSTLAVLPKGAMAGPRPDSYASLIDLHKCDGCPDRDMPACVRACREGRAADFPEPDPQQLRDYWPQKKHEDMSKKRHLFDRLTPYNWIFVQKVEVDGRKVSIPRRCMHCDNPPCAKLCPFGVKHKTPEGPVYIDTDLCFGGSKCRDVCPWHIPQRQAGVGLYTLWQESLPVGGGVMFKCDLCRGRLADGDKPHCTEACPRGAMTIGRRDEIEAEARRRRDAGEHVYGLDENGGTSTFYVSPVPFDKLDAAVTAQAKERKLKWVHRLHDAPNVLEKRSKWAMASLLAPLAGILGAITLTRGRAGEREEQS